MPIIRLNPISKLALSQIKIDMFMVNKTNESLSHIKKDPSAAIKDLERIKGLSKIEEVLESKEYMISPDKKATLIRLMNIWKSIETKVTEAIEHIHRGKYSQAIELITEIKRKITFEKDAQKAILNQEIKEKVA